MKLILLDNSYKIIEEAVINKPDSFMILKNIIEQNLIKISKKNFIKFIAIKHLINIILK